MVDIHSHVLPGVDDGAADMDKAIAMLKQAKNEGTKSIFATPHCIFGESRYISLGNIIQERFEEFTNEAMKQDIDIDIYLGQEIFVSYDIPVYLKEGKVLTLNNSRYVLLELPLQTIPLYFNDLLYNLELDGYVPIITHPERNEEILKNAKIIDTLIQRGSLMQVDSSSLRGLFGKSAKKLAFKLLKNNKVHFVASDAHSCNGGRNTSLQEAYNMVLKKKGKKKADELFILNGQKVINNEEIV